MLYGSANQTSIKTSLHKPNLELYDGLFLCSESPAENLNKILGILDYLR